MKLFIKQFSMILTLVISLSTLLTACEGGGGGDAGMGKQPGNSSALPVFK